MAEKATQAQGIQVCMAVEGGSGHNQGILAYMPVMVLVAGGTR